MRSAAVKATVAFAYVAVLVWVGWVGLEDDRGADWDAFLVVLFWAAWLGGSIFAGAMLRRPAALGLPAVAFGGLIAYALLWPDDVSNEAWAVDLAIKALVSFALVRLGVGLGERWVNSPATG